MTQNHLQIVVYKSPKQYFEELLGLVTLPIILPPPTPPSNLRTHCLALNAMMIFMNNDSFMQDVVDDMNEDNPCTCGRMKYKLNKDSKSSFLRY